KFLAIRTKNLSSPSPNASGKSSPCPSFSGTIDEGILAISPCKRIDIKTNIPLTSKPIAKDQSPKSPRLHINAKASTSEPNTNGLSHSIENTIETELIKIPEETQHITWSDLVEQDESQGAIPHHVQQQQTTENILEPEPILTFDQYSQTSGFIDEYLTLAQWRDKYENNQIIENTVGTPTGNAVSHTKKTLDEMENMFMKRNSNQPSNLVQSSFDLSKENTLKPKSTIVEKSTKKLALPEEKRVKTGTQLKYSNVVVRPLSVTKPNSLPKATTNRLHTKPTVNVIGRSSSTQNIATNANLIRKPFPITTMNKSKVFPQKETLLRDSDRRSVRATVQRSNGISGVPSNISSRLAARSKTMIDLHKTPTANENTMSRVSMDKLHVRKSEPRSILTRTEDDEGWLTVKARRRSSLHWSNRFNQPSGYASLPTLTLLNEKEPSKVKNNKKVIKTVETETNVASSVTKGANIEPMSKFKNQANVERSELKSKMLNAKDAEKPESIISRATILQRQRSDITGIKLNNLRKEYFKKLKEHLKKNSSTKEQTNEKLDILPTLYASCLESETLNIEMNKRDAESDNETESDENQRKLLEEEECLERQIFELQNTEIDVDTEIDDAECDSEGELEQCDENMTLEAKYQHLLSDLSTGERIQTLATLQAFVSRHPGVNAMLHQKLSSPSHRSLTEILKKYQEKQQRARDMREILSREKTLKLQALLARVEDVKIAKQKLIEEKRQRMDFKLLKAAENRNQYLKHKIRKAHDEEEKLKEIAFIKSLEAQNKRLDLMELRKEERQRLQDLETERQKRMQEKVAKEAAVEKRR
ncbi:S phase cyclin A-associated protein in the endoplasmic reticulum-like, partial [Contarinia nasturtii]|uniref:S phase cyclin A-associated protein in the endoplasmic reticulum-like n=1 Tax=Contarinia nasturtii TaxID=265458 RepID=UPI0012D4652E